MQERQIKMNSRFFKKNIAPYVPGEQPTDSRVIKLNTNESPYPPSPHALARLNAKEGESLKLYSDPESTLSRNAIARLYGVPSDCVIMSNGSDEILAFIYIAFFGGEKLYAPDLSYGFYPVFARLFDADFREIPLLPDFRIDTEGFINADGHIIIANPNAPTGLAVSTEHIRKMLENRERIVVVDEAYCDFGGESSVSLIEEYDNLIVVGTFSKSRNMAGARLGFAIADSQIISALNAVRYSFNPYNINRFTDIMGAESADDREYFAECVAKIIATREKAIVSLTNLGFECLPSKTNFILTRPPIKSGKEYAEYLSENGILIRYFPKERIKDYVRISIGSDAEMGRLLEITAEYLKKGGVK